MSFNVRTLVMVTVMAAVGFFVLKQTASYVPIPAYRTFTSSI